MKVAPLAQSSWVDEALAISKKSKKRLALDALGHRSSAYLNRLSSGVLPTARTVRRVAEAAGIPIHLVPLLQSRAGHPEESLEYLAALEHVGRVFCAQSKVELDPIVGVPEGWVAGTTWKVGDEPQKPRPVLVPGRTFEQQPLLDPSDPLRIIDFVVLPRPTALAIDLAILGFARRGDVLSSGNALAFADLMKRYGEHWSLDWAKKIVGDAGERVRLPRLLSGARDILRARGVAASARRAIASEFVQAWAD